MTYIERDALLSKMRPVEQGDERAAALLSDVKKIFHEAIMDIPAADVVKVVRCRDCRHIADVEGGPPLCCLRDIACSYDDFCKAGEKTGGLSYE